MKILVLHAYSSKNRGDGLLVDLAAGFVRDAFGPEAEIDVIAMDAPSFSYLEDATVHQLPVMTGTPLERVRDLARMGLDVLLCRPSNITSLVPSYRGTPDLIIGVGGGYMRSEGGISSLKAMIAHALPLIWATRSGLPTYYLSQSVGPFRGVVGQIMSRAIPKLDRILVRDDRSLALFPDADAVSRAPDMAIFWIARSLPSPETASSLPFGAPRLIARDLTRSPEVKRRYVENLHALLDGIPGIVPALQSAGRGNDDPEFYRSLGLGEKVPLLRDILKRERPRVAVSVRLHGALESIAAGVPTIHLSYERKGFGAYSDLGIGEFVHNVNSFDAGLVIEQANRLIISPDEFWNKVRPKLANIREAYAQRLQDARAVAARRGRETVVQSGMRRLVGIEGAP